MTASKCIHTLDNILLARHSVVLRVSNPLDSYDHLASAKLTHKRNDDDTLDLKAAVSNCNRLILSMPFGLTSDTGKRGYRSCWFLSLCCQVGAFVVEDLAETCCVYRLIRINDKTVVAFNNSLNDT